MEIYQVIHGPALIPAGTVVQLSPTQVVSRKKQLRKLESGWFLALTDICFKTGEVLTFYKPLDQSVLPAFMPPEMLKPTAGHPNYRRKTKRTEPC